MENSFSSMIFKKFVYSNKKNMAISLWELQTNLTLKDEASSTEESQKAVQTVYVKEKTNTRVICYVVKWMITVSLTVSSLALTSLSHCFFFCLHFCILSHFKIIRCIVKSFIATSRYFLLKYNWKNKTWKVLFGQEGLGAQTGIQVSLTVWTRHCYSVTTHNVWSLLSLRCVKTACFALRRQWPI